MTQYFIARVDDPIGDIRVVVDMFESRARMERNEFTDRVKEAVVEWIKQPENYGDGKGGWDLPDYDWTWFDVSKAISDTPEIQDELAKYGITYLGWRECYSVFDGNDIVIPQEGKDWYMYR